MKLQLDPRLPTDLPMLIRRLYDLFREIAISVNGSSMWDTQSTAAPTSGNWAQGNMCKNTAPVEAGAATAKYVVVGWVCTASGTPGTWLPMRTLTGN